MMDRRVEFRKFSEFFWWSNLVRLYSKYKILYPKRRIESYSIMGTIVSPNKMLLKCGVQGLGLRVWAFNS